MSAIVNHLLKDLNNNQNAHTRMSIDPQLPIGYMPNILNHIDKNPSSHYYLRNGFIEIITIYKAKKKGIHSFNYYKELEGKGTWTNLQHALCCMQPSHIEELKELLIKYNIDFEIGNNYKPKWMTESPNLINEISQQKWEIEKIYLDYWLNSNDIKPQSETGFFIDWKTDGQRISSLYKKNWC
jgi:hypothetical protein